jgi:Cu2+-exporting ATPase
VAARFCCAGCLAVAQTIRTAGLSAFYALRGEHAAAGQPPAQDDSTREAQAAAHLVRRVDAQHCEVALLVERMRCGACVWLLESWLARQPGIVGASVNFATRRATVRFAFAQTDLAAILHAIALVGYHAHPYDRARREALARREGRALLLRTGLALFGMMQVMMFAIPAYITVDGIDAASQALLDWASLVLTLPVVLYSAAPFFGGAWRDVKAGRLGMDVPIALGIGCAFGASAWATIGGSGAVYYDSITMFVALILLARLVEARLRERAGDALEVAAREVPPVAERLTDYPGTNALETVAATALVRGDYVLVAAGAGVPADGVVVEGRSRVEEALLTGESWPRAKASGDRVMAGSVNRESPLVVRVTAAGEATMSSALTRLTERAASERPRIARLSDRIAAIFVTGLLLVAALSALAWWTVDPSRALSILLAVLVVSCPCALSLATPAALACAAGALSRRRILCVRPDALEALSRVTHVVLDKTGTLTNGDVRLLDVVPAAGVDRAACMAIAAALEQGSSHPLASALREHAGSAHAAEQVIAVPGNGVEAFIDGTRYRLGREKWVAEIARAAGLPVQPDAGLAEQTRIVLGGEAGPLAALYFGDGLRHDAGRFVAALREAGLGVSIVSGDHAGAVRRVAQAVGVDEWRAEASPDDKRSIIASLQRRGAVVAMVGDGINDAPGLARADVSLTLGSAAALTQWTADVVVLGDDLDGVAFALQAARRAFRVIRQNLAWALAYNALAIPLAATGHLSPLVAAAGMSASSLIVVSNAWRLSWGRSKPYSARNGRRSFALRGESNRHSRDAGKAVSAMRVHEYLQL